MIYGKLLYLILFFLIKKSNFLFMDPRADPNRHSFLHTKECNEKWKIYVNCINLYPVLNQFVDVCAREYGSLFICFKKERRAKADLNHKLARKKISQTVKKVVETEENEIF